MKKSIIITIVLIPILIFLIYLILLFKDYNKIKNSFDLSINALDKTIGIEGLCDFKNIEFNEEKKNIDASLKNLLSIMPQYIEYNRIFDRVTLKLFGKNEIKKIDNYKIQKLTNVIDVFNDNFKIDTISEYDWDVNEQRGLNYKKPSIRTFIYDSEDLCNLSMFFGFTEKYLNNSTQKIESNKLFDAMLKTYLLNIYVNKSLFYRIKNNLKGLPFFFEKLIYDEYSKKEMEKMLLVIKQINPLIPDYNDHIKMEFDYRKKDYEYSVKEYPYYSFMIRIIYGNHSRIMEKLNENITKRNYEEISKICEENPVLTPPIFQFTKQGYIDYIILKSHLALFQAYLEEKLGKEITAVDPYDNNPIRYYEDNNKKIFYCLGHEGKDHGGQNGNIVECIFEGRIDNNE